MRSLVEKTDDAPVKMPHPERVARLKTQQARLVGIKIEATLEPSHSLLDAVWQIKNDDILRFLSPEVCTSRPQEAGGVKKEFFTKQDAAGQIKAVQREDAPHADLSTEFRVRQALTRRSLAFDQIGLLTFESQESYHDYLFSLVLKEALPTHYPITVDQVLRADKQFWLRLMELTRDGILPLAAAPGRGMSNLPLEIHFPGARLDPLFNASLQPLAMSHSGPIHDRNLKPFQSNWGPYGKAEQKGGKSEQKGGRRGDRGKSGKGGK